MSGTAAAPVGPAHVEPGLLARLRDEPYAGYTYGYPHKTAYRTLRPPVRLGTAWADEPRTAVFGYVHLPFCEMRCGFCNLFTTANPRDDLVVGYLRALRREADTVVAELGPVRAARLAVGGGTPTYLDPDRLASVLALMSEVFGVAPGQVPTSVETSPATTTTHRLVVLEQAGVSRLSIGVQSFDLAEVHSAGRPQRGEQVPAALDAIRTHSSADLNIDLMYGLQGQTVESWLASLRAALRWDPEEIFCYPLYVRRLTGLGRHPREWSDQRLRLYRAGRDFLLAHGYRQTSKRRFVRARGSNETWPEPEYSCQSDGMIGLGCGARSYTRALHYSREYAVGRAGVRRLIEGYNRTTDFTALQHGIRLSPAEQHRRFALQSLLHVDGLDEDAFAARFGGSARAALPQLGELVEAGLATDGPGALRLTAEGLELSDAIGPWLYSAEVRRASGAYEWQ